MKRLISLVILALGGFAVTAGGQTVHLLPKTTLEAGPVHVGDVGTIEGATGDVADKLAQTVVLEQLPADHKVTAEQVLFALFASQDCKAMAAGVQVSGATACEIASKPEPVAAAVVASSPVGTAEPAATGPTLAALIREAAVHELGAADEDVRVEFDTVSPYLDRPTAADAVWKLRPLSRTFLGTVQWDVQLVSGNRVLTRTTVQARVTQRTDILVTTKQIQRGDVVAEGMVRHEEKWIDRKLPSLLSREDDLVGQEAQRSVAEGGVIDQRDFKPVQLAARGDAVTVYYVSGSLVIKTAARAMGDGRLHDLVALRNEETGEKFEGTLIGKDLATVGTPATARVEQQLREQR